MCHRHPSKGTSMSIITPQKMASDILKMLNDVTSEYPKEERDELKIAILNSLSRAMFNGPVETKEKNERTI
jgi:hypothetical protein